jgi:hypothetical protein
VGAILSQERGFTQDRRMLAGEREARRTLRNKAHTEAADALLQRLPKGRARHAFEEARLAGGSAWLSARPLEHLGLVLDRQTFRDAIALRMGVPLPEPLPPSCPSCGEEFTVSHALKCKKGGWVGRRHREVLRAWSTLFKRVSPTVVEEPHLGATVGMVFQRDTTTTKLDARADILARGIFSPQQDAYFDVAVLDTGSDSREHAKSVTVLKAKEASKHAKYDERVQPLGKFAPLVCSIYGALAPEASRTLSLVSRGLDSKAGEREEAAFLHRVYLQVATLKASSMCLRARAQFTPPPCVVDTGLR